MILIIGTGRSGTHWVAHLLQSHGECAGLIEAEPIFSYATQMALNPALCSELMPRIIEEYKAEVKKTAPRIFFDKSHPNIWNAEALADAFPTARFIGTDRSVFGTVASMLDHGGVQDWIRRWREYPVPNRFLGIDERNQDIYPSLSLEEQCALSRGQAGVPRFVENASKPGADRKDRAHRLGVALSPQKHPMCPEAISANGAFLTHRWRSGGNRTNPDASSAIR